MTSLGLALLMSAFALYLVAKGIWVRHCVAKFSRYQTGREAAKVKWEEAEAEAVYADLYLSPWRWLDRWNRDYLA